MSRAETEALAERIRAGDRQALARAITLVESTRTDHRVQADALLEQLLPHTGRAVRVGISGAPGVGKSSFIEVLGLHVVGGGQHLGVLAVDPSSSRDGGSILGDKTRMDRLVRQPDAFVRPSPSGGSLGGVARRTREAMLVCEAAGFDVVLVETVGVGQSEVAVADLVDVFVLLVAPGGGDDLQGVKRGVMELADVVVVNKADGDLMARARQAASDYGHALHLLRPRTRWWTPVVLMCSALEGSGVDAVWDAVLACHAARRDSGELARERSRQAESWLWTELSEVLVQSMRSDARVAALLPEVEAAVRSGRSTPSAGVARLLAAFRSIAGTPIVGA